MARGRERGQILAMYALLLPVLLCFGALVVDVGHAFVLKRHLQKSADAAALAAAQALPLSGSCAGSEEEAIAIAYSGSPGGHNANPSLPSVTTTVECPTAAKVKVTQSAKAQLFFAGVLPGTSDYDVRARAVASRQMVAGGTPYAIFVHELCGASTGNKGLLVNGEDTLVQGAIHSNGQFKVNNSGFTSEAKTSVYRPPHADSPSPPGPSHPGACNGSAPLQIEDATDSEYCTIDCTPPCAPPNCDPVRNKFEDWITPYDTKADVLANAGPCTQTKTADYTFTASDPNGVWCVDNHKFEIPNGVCTAARNCKLTIIAKTILIAGGGKLQPYDVVNADSEVIAWNTPSTDPITINYSTSSDWTGFIINRFGGIKINAGGVTSPHDGLLEAEHVEINGEDFTMLGKGPPSDSGGTPGPISLEE